MPTRNDRETAISSLMASVGVQRLLEEAGEVGLMSESLLGERLVSICMEPSSRSQTWATIKEITAKLPVNIQMKTVLKLESISDVS